jgi:RNA polymerase sigma factor (sigma-70 family)
MKLMNESRKLLADFAERGSETAFRDLVNRYINLVHSTALRLVNGDSHLAEDISQTVFLNLARQAATLSDEVMIGGWLHRNTCFVAVNIMRSERRRQDRERKAVEMNAIEDHSAANFANAAPFLDEAINELGPEDRTAILLRFFEQMEFRAVAEMMGSTDDAARMRVNRALDKLHSMLTQRGVTLSAAALGTALAVETVKAAPAGLAASVSAAALGGAITGGATLTIAKILGMSKIKIAIVSSIAVAILAVPALVQQQTNESLRRENEALRQQLAQRSSSQEQLAQASQDTAAVDGIRPQTEAQIRELARLRNEVSLLRSRTNELAKMRQEIEMLRQATTSSNEFHFGFRGLSGNSPNEDQKTDSCINNLRILDSAKQQWGLEARKQVTDTPAINDLRPYIDFNHVGFYLQPAGGQATLVCPDGGTYTIGSLGEKPTCSNPKHVLP